MIELVKNDQLTEARIDSNRIFKINKSNVRFSQEFHIKKQMFPFLQLKIDIIQPPVLVDKSTPKKSNEQVFTKKEIEIFKQRSKKLDSNKISKKKVADLIFCYQI